MSRKQIFHPLCLGRRIAPSIFSYPLHLFTADRMARDSPPPEEGMSLTVHEIFSPVIQARPLDRDGFFPGVSQARFFPLIFLPFMESDSPFQPIY